MDGQVKVKHKKHYVKIKPKEPKFKKVPMPGRNYVYVREDWRWNEATTPGIGTATGGWKHRRPDRYGYQVVG